MSHDESLGSRMFVADDPFARAWALVTSAMTFGPAEWYEVHRRARAIDNGLHLSAVRKLGEAMAGHPQSRALSALGTAAREIPMTAIANGAATGRPAGARPSRKLTRETLDYAGRAVRYAALAMALAPDLEARHVALLVTPVFAVMRSAAEDAFARSP